jgi:hypothetical protein
MAAAARSRSTGRSDDRTENHVAMPPAAEPIRAATTSQSNARCCAAQ